MPRQGRNIYKRKDGRWEGRNIKNTEAGKHYYGYVYGKTYNETAEKLSLFTTSAESETTYGNITSTVLPLNGLNYRQHSLRSPASQSIEIFYPSTCFRSSEAAQHIQFAGAR